MLQALEEKTQRLERKDEDQRFQVVEPEPHQTRFNKKVVGLSVEQGYSAVGVSACRYASDRG